MLISNRTAACVLSSNLTKAESLLAYKMCWTPSLGYSLGVTTFLESDLQKVQSIATSSFLKKIGVNGTSPARLLLAHENLGDRDLSVKQGIQQINK